ncbi:MAG: efflux RND transporter periplasmic adaptor subunit [Bryobacteraceae bacterium]
MKWRLLILTVAVALLALGGWGAARLYRTVAAPPAVSIPTTTVKLGDVIFTITARGELIGGNSQMLAAPMVGGNEVILTSLRRPGEVVAEGDIVAEFDTTEQTFKLKEAEADLAEAEQKVIQAKAETEARAEEDRYALIKAKADLRLAELDSRRNEMLAAIAVRQNELAVAAAKDHLVQLEKDLGERKATAEAAIKIQEAARSKATMQAATARRNIESMTLKAKTAGYVNIQQNQNSNVMFTGMQLPMFQVGDMVRPGMAVAQIPDLANWEVTAKIGELDRGHLALGQPARVRVAALPGREYAGQIKTIGGTVGPPWDRNFECRVALEAPTPELRPGMSTRIVITTQTLPKSLWIPAQALFEADGRTFVYTRTAAGFVPADVKLVRRSESQVVLTGVKAGQVIALASPDQRNQPQKGASSSAAQALPK